MMQSSSVERGPTGTFSRYAEANDSAAVSQHAPCQHAQTAKFRLPILQAQRRTLHLQLLLETQPRLLACQPIVLSTSHNSCRLLTWLLLLAAARHSMLC